MPNTGLQYGSTKDAQCLARVVLIAVALFSPEVHCIPLWSIRRKLRPCGDDTWGRVGLRDSCILPVVYIRKN